MKKHNMPKDLSARIYSYLCVPRGSVFHFDLHKNRCNPHAVGYQRAMNLEETKTVYVCHKSTEKWIWFIECRILGTKEEVQLIQIGPKYVKKSLKSWGDGTPFVVLPPGWWHTDKMYFLDRARKLAPHFGVFCKDDSVSSEVDDQAPLYK